MADQAAVTVTIGPAIQAQNNAQCFALSPNPVPVRAGQSLQFHNATTQSVTIVGDGVPGTGAPGRPWTTAPVGGDSGTITFSSAATVYYEACVGQIAHPWYGMVLVTVN